MITSEMKKKKQNKKQDGLKLKELARGWTV